MRHSSHKTTARSFPRCLQLAGSVGASVVRGLAGLDSWLEGNKLLPELKPLEVPEAVQDEDGQLNAECKEVRADAKQQHAVCGRRLMPQRCM